MAYIINGKVHTHHPLMDEIVHNCKTILDGIVLKNEKVANNYETADSLIESDAFLAIKNDAMHLEILPISEQFLLDHGFSTYDSINIVHDIHKLPEYAECKLSRYNSKDTRLAVWNSELARYEFITGGVAGRNINTPVTLKNGKFVYSDGTVCDGHVIALKEDYYIDGVGNILLQDPEDKTKFYNLDGTEFLATPTKCLAGIIREFANDYPKYEQNMYYRTLNGMPAYGTNDFDVYIDSDKYQYLLDLDDNNAEFNFGIPIHEFTDEQLLTLDSLGILNDVINEYYTNAEKINKPYYKYLTFLGVKKIDLYQARFAKEWDILYMPPVEHLVSDRFKEAYKINRDIYYRRTYQQAYSIYSDYYEEIVMILILCQTFTDLVVDTPEFYIRRDVFDLRTAQYFLEANGVKFYADIPLKYQVLLIKNLNKLIKYKSTMKNINDILDIFSMSDSVIYKFYLFKKYLYNIYESGHTYDVTSDDIDEAGWTQTDLIKNGSFSTGDLTYWEASIAEYSDDPAKVGYRIKMEPLSKYNTTPYLAYYNKTSDSQEFSLSQMVNAVPIGKYRIRARLGGTARLRTGIKFFINDVPVMGIKVTKGDEWIDVVSNEFNLDGVTDLNIEYKGSITPYYEGKIDNIYIEEYSEEIDCGDEDEIEGFFDDENAEILDFFDENGTDEYPTQLYLYDFGNEDGDNINTGDTTDAEFDLQEANRVIFDDSGNVYDLEFVKVPLGEGYDDYIKDGIYRQAYDSVVRQDKYWNGDDTHNYIKNLHLAKDFTIEGSKFMGMEFNISYKEYAYQKQYYMSMYMNADINTNDIKIAIPSIKQNAQFTLQNLIIFIYCCNGIYDAEEAAIVDTLSKFIKYKEKETFKPYTIIDGGHPWDKDTGKEYEEEEEEEFETPDLDFGDEEDPKFIIIRDQFLQVLDFGYHIDIDYNDPDLEIYDYGDETGDLTPDEKAKEAEEPDEWPFQDLCDFGDEGLFKEEDINGDISVPVVRSKLTKEYDFIDEDVPVDPDLPIDYTDYIYDFGAKTVGTVDYIESPNDPIYNENILIPEPPLDYFPPYYVQNKDMSLFRLYEYDPENNHYRLIKNYGSGNPDEPWEYDIKDVITEENYIRYLGHFAIDMNTGEYTKITRANYINYLGKLTYMRFPWYASPPGKYTKIVDGHHNMQDEDMDDVKYDVNTMKYYKLDGTEANGEITLINDKYKQVFDGGETIYTLDRTKQAYYDWLRFEYPSRWIPLVGRVYGFNMKANLNELAIDIGARHSIFGWARGYTLEECGVADFIIKNKVSDISEMYNIYETNTKCYHNLIDKMENATTRDERQVLDYLYYSLYTRPFDQDTYKLKSGDLATTYDEILEEKDYTLYKYYVSIREEQDPDARQEILRNTLNDLVDTLSYYISGSNLKYVLSFISTNSTDAILGYMMEIINFFKSWKVYFLDPHNTYIVDDKYNHMVYSGDTITEAKVKDWHTDTFTSRDSAALNVRYDVFEENKVLAHDGTHTSNSHKGAQVVDISSHYTDENILEEKYIDGGDNGITKTYDDLVTATDNENLVTPDEEKLRVITSHTGAADMEYEYTDIIDGNATESIPFYVINGGRVNGRHNIKVLDGGGAGLLSRDYYVNGKDLYPDIKFVNLPRPKDERQFVVIDGNENWEDDDLTYVVDGGPSFAKCNVSRTAITKVDEKNRVVVDARISSAPDNAITLQDDGLYADKTTFATKASVIDTKNNMKYIKNNIKSKTADLYAELGEVALAIKSPEDLDNTINGIYDNYFKNSKYVIRKLGDDSFIESINNDAQQAANDLISWFDSINPFADTDSNG